MIVFSALRLFIYWLVLVLFSLRLLVATRHKSKGKKKIIPSKVTEAAESRVCKLGGGEWGSTMPDAYFVSTSQWQSILKMELFADVVFHIFLIS